MSPRCLWWRETPSAVGCRLSAVGCRLSAVGCRLGIVAPECRDPTDEDAEDETLDDAIYDVLTKIDRGLHLRPEGYRIDTDQLDADQIAPKNSPRREQGRQQRHGCDAVFRKIDVFAKPGSILASNTSYLDIDAIAAATARPQDVLDLRFVSPANVMKLLELVRGSKTAPEVAATGMELGKTFKKMPMLCASSFGFIGKRIYNAYSKQCEFMLEDGAWPEDVDNALTGMGFAMGPFAVADLSGLDIAWRMRKTQLATRANAT